MLAWRWGNDVQDAGCAEAVAGGVQAVLCLDQVSLGPGEAGGDVPGRLRRTRTAVRERHRGRRVVAEQVHRQGGAPTGRPAGNLTCSTLSRQRQGRLCTFSFAAATEWSMLGSGENEGALLRHWAGMCALLDE